MSNIIHDKRDINKILISDLPKNLTFDIIYRTRLRQEPWCWNKSGHKGDCEVWYLGFDMPEGVVCLKWKIEIKGD